jgi:hypothetical protein
VIRASRTSRGAWSLAVLLSACAYGAAPEDGGGGPPRDGGRIDGARADASGADADTPRDAGSCGGATCAPFQYCDAGTCRDYPGCAGDGTCPEGEVCHNRFCVPGDVDIDGDGSPASVDCDETNPDRYPGAEEICSLIDENCNGLIDEGDPAAICEFYPGGGVCIDGSCGCPPGTFDLDRDVTGCECLAQPAIDQGLSCAQPIDLGDIVDTGAMLRVNGNVMPDDREVWYRFRAVDSPDNSCDNFHVRVQFLSNPENTFELTVFRGSCATADCADTGFEDYRWATDLRITGGDGMLTGQCPCWGPTGVPVDNVSPCIDDSADFFVRVRRRAGTELNCNTYGIELSNGLYDTI